jgi:activator of HSP90 ATPase
MTGGRAASISMEEGGKASMFGGDIQARNIELVPGKRVVQAWRSGAWPEGVYSIVHFELSPEGQGTKLVFDQAGYPAETQDMLSGGWSQMYWTPMEALLSAKQ